MSEHQNHRERVRQKIIENGFSTFMDHEILEFLLFYGIPRKNTNDIAHELIKKFGSLNDVLNAPYSELKSVKNMTGNAALLLSCYNGLTERLKKNEFDAKKTVLCPRDILPYFKAVFHNKLTESIAVVCLNSKQKVLSCIEVSQGTCNTVSFSPRAIAEIALRYQAAGIIVAHNHPSEDISPSNADTKFTITLKTLLEALGVCFIDHLIISSEYAYSYFLKNEISRMGSDNVLYSLDILPLVNMEQNSVLVVKDKNGFLRKDPDDV